MPCVCVHVPALFAGADNAWSGVVLPHPAADSVTCKAPTVYLIHQGGENVCTIIPFLYPTLVYTHIRTYFYMGVTGERVVKEVYLKNISDKPVDIASPLLDPTGPFCILNAFRHLEPGTLHRVAISFGPTDPQPCYEPLCLNYHGNSAYLKLLLVGRGVPLNLVLEGVEDSQLDFGHTLAGDTSSRQVKVWCSQ